MYRASFAVLCVLSLVFVPSADAHDPWQITVFTRVGSPGSPEGIVVGSDGTVYVGTHNAVAGDVDAPSRVFAYNGQGRQVHEWAIAGQNTAEEHGLLGMAADARDRLYICDRNPARIVRLDPETNVQTTYGTFRDVPRCILSGGSTDCSDTFSDEPPWPNFPVFGPDGSLYVSDLKQALIWRIPPGGGRPEIWLTDARLDSVFGPNGMQFMADGRTLLIAHTASMPPGDLGTATGKLWTVPVLADGSAGAMSLFWEGRPLDGPDGLAIAQSGNVYVVMAGSNQVVQIGPDGQERRREPATPLHNALLEIPVDGPGSTTFFGDRLLFTNHSAIVGNPASWAVLDVAVGEPGLPLFRPAID